VVVIDPMQKMMALNVIIQLIGAIVKLNALLRFANIEGFIRGTILF
jgi:hypothetical protein